MNEPVASHHLQWLARFAQTHGRPLRVLHIGNVANNAYLNAKILRACGIHCDVICCDYYHIMGCPEWEDADFRGSVADQFYPDWEAVHLGPFRRPRWFAQGPMRWAIAYLRARHSGPRALAWVWWNLLRAMRWSICSRQLAGLRPPLAAARACWRDKIRKPLALWWGLGWNAFKTAPRRMVHQVFRILRRVPGLGWVLSGLARAFRTLAGLARRAGDRRPGVARSASRRSRQPPAWFDRRSEELIARFAEVFPGRADRLSSVDLSRYSVTATWWRAILRPYDIIIGYATEGRWPLLTGARPYFAYEHGTIRNIPFEPNEQGRLCAAIYRLADGVFITNCDNIVAARRLGLPRYRFIPHPVNEQIGGDEEAVRQLRAELQARLRCDFLVFHPPRQHWEARRHPDWEKANDILIRGFARFVREVDPHAGAVFVQWGQTIEASRHLLESLGVADRVLWIPPQPNVAMIRYIRACDLLADQFFLGAFGSTMPKALLHGCPAMLYLDEERHRWCFPEMPPVINARSPDEVFAGLTRLYKDPHYAKDLIARGRAWYARYHSNRVIADTFVEAFRRVWEEHTLDEGAGTTGGEHQAA